MRRVATSVALLLLASVAARAEWPPGCLNYCGFEARWDEAGWRDSAWAQGGIPEIDFDGQVKYHGRYSLRIIGAEGEDRHALQLAGNDLDPTKTYVFRGWVRTEKVHGEAKVAALVHGDQGPIGWVDLGPGAVFSGTHDWTHFELPIRSFPPGSKRIYLYAVVHGEGRAWFDEFSLALEGVEVPLGGERVYSDADYAGARFDDAALPKNLLTGLASDGGLGGWSVECGRPVVERTGGPEGGPCLRFDGAPDARYVVWQRVRIDPRRAYRLSALLKTDLQAGLSCLRVIPFRRDMSGFGWWFVQDHTSEFLYGRERSGWHRETIVLREFRPETEYLHVYLEAQDFVGRVWFGSVELAPLSLAETKAVKAG